MRQQNNTKMEEAAALSATGIYCYEQRIAGQMVIEDFLQR